MSKGASPKPAREEMLVLQGQKARASEPRLRPSENHVYFDAVVRHGSIRKAADRLHIASSALNRRILDLEKEVGSPLFERLPRGVRLTEAGEMLLTYVRWSLKELRKVEHHIDQLRGVSRGVVRIAVAESVTPSLLPEAISSYQSKHQNVAFHVVVDGPEVLMEALAKDSVDLILTHELPRESLVEVLAVAEHPLCAFVVPGHPLTQNDELSLSDCVAYRLAFPDHSLAARGLLDAAIREASLELEPDLESDSIETLKAYARRSEAISFSFHLGSQEEAPGLVPIRIRDPRCSEARLYLVARRSRVLPVAAASFAELLRDTLKSRISKVSVSVA